MAFKALRKHFKINRFAKFTVAATSLGALFLFTLPTEARAEQSEKQIIKCLEHFDLLEDEKKETSSSSTNSQELIVTAISVDPLTHYKNLLGLGCYVMDQKIVEEMANKAVAIKVSSIPKFVVVSGATSGVLKEPGLMGLDGANGFLTEMLVTELYGLWVMATYRGARVPAPSEKEAEIYVDVHLDAAKKDPDGAAALRLRAWDYLKDVILSPDTPSDEAKVFITAVQNYIREEQVRLAQEAQNKYADYKAEKDRTITHMSALFHTGHAPYDPLHEMKMALATSAKTGGYLATMLGSKAIMNAARKKTLKELAVKMADFDDEADDVATWLAGKGKGKVGKLNIGTHRAFSTGKGGARSAISKAVGKAAKVPVKLASKAAGRIAVASVRVAGMIGTKLVNVVPFIGQIVDVIITTAETASKIAKNAAIEKRLKGAVDAAKSANWDLKKMLNTRSGLEMVALYYAKATGGDSPASVEIPVPACRACYFAEINYKGENFCSGDRISDLRNFYDGTANRKFNNKIRSVQMFADKTCEAPSVILHENQRHTGHRVVLHTSAPDLSAVRRGKKAHWDKQASSVEYRDKAAPRCEVCLYSKKDYKGSKVCTSSPENDLSLLGVNNSVSSIKFYNQACKDAKYWAYDRKEFQVDKKGKGYTVAKSSTGYVGKNWNNKISSVYFSAEGENPTLEKAKGGCRVCLYDIVNRKGQYVCVNAGQNVADMNKVKAGADIIKFRNKASSVQFISDHCRVGAQLTLELFGQASYKGSREVHTKNANLKRFNNGASSVKVSLKSKEDVSKLCRVCLYSSTNYKGDRRCFTGNANTQKLKFNNKAQSIKFELNACKGTGGAIFYENNMKGHELFANRDISNLKNTRRGKKANWLKQISSLKFSKTMTKQRKARKSKTKAAAKTCKVCLYADANYKGRSVCSGPTKVPDLKPAKLRDIVSSIKFSGNSCKKPRLVIYEDPKYKSYSRIVTKNISDLKKLKMRVGGKKTFNNDMASFKFTN